MDWQVFGFGFVLGAFLFSVIFSAQPRIKVKRQKTVFDLSKSAQAQRAIEETKYIFEMAPRLIDQLQEVLGTFELAAQKTADSDLKKDLDEGIERILTLRQSFQEVLRLTSNEKGPTDKSGPDIKIVKDLPALVVDDNAVVRKTSETLLSALGFECETAENGAKALEVLSQKQFGVILLDISMPGIDGVSVTKQIRQGSGPNKNTAIVAVTGLARRGDREKLLSEGINGYLAKPIKIDELRNLLAKG
ncbi:MAG: hypothetical protein A4S09_03740 [Proteobacteria bacterium SG_bin7]|nr:MAG: hypothetical protein A4S09_03740 [Proteobacteria bacterium SG_bin7]